MTQNSNTTTPQDRFEVRDNVLCMGGKKITEIAEDLGTTTFYCYDSKLITDRIFELRAALPARVRLHYAVKANPMPEVVGLIAPLVDGLDVASERELSLALDSGKESDRISFAGPGKRVPELEAAVKSGITINVESPLELERIDRIARDSGLRANVALRVNPDFELKSSGMRMSGGPKPFGIDAEQLPEILASLGDRCVTFTGFHIFAGSQNLKPDSIVEAQSKALELAFELAEHAPEAPRKINIGGGFGIPYFPGESSLDLSPITENLELLVERLDARFPDASLIVELGRYIVGEAGVYVTEITDKKVSRGRTYLITNGGLHHHLSLSGNFGQVIRKNYPVAAGSNVVSDDMETVSIVGPLCTPLDILADQMELPKMEVGDLVAVFQSGAYGLTASPLRFLSHPEPMEVMV